MPNITDQVKEIVQPHSQEVDSYFRMASKIAAYPPGNPSADKPVIQTQSNALNGYASGLNNFIYGLNSSTGNDTYVFRRAQGNDGLYNLDIAAERVDTQALWNEAAHDKRYDGIDHPLVGTGSDILDRYAGTGIRHAADVRSAAPYSGGDQPENSDLSSTLSSDHIMCTVSITDQPPLQGGGLSSPSAWESDAEVITQDIADLAAARSDPLPGPQRGSFTANQTKAPMLNAWTLSDALLRFQLASADSAALNGELANPYGSNGTLSRVGLTAAPEFINDSHSGPQARSLQALAGSPSTALKLA
jgi:hypothetical protein